MKKVEVDLVRIVLAALAVVVLLALMQPDPLPPTASRAARDLVVYQPGPSPAPILELSGDQRTLAITAHARRDQLVCMRGECRLVEEWVGQ